ncbi:MAG: SpoVA/SpoVAEb family sporulation membrane protein [Clostridia bacterium]|nr:SpoVA/SpoVAEb family sporulation membrane protein [Clostridia bacterium]
MSIYAYLILAFIGGGILSLIAQLLIDLTSLTPARILVAYVSAGVLLYAVGVYDFLFKIFGAGVSTPLIGFGAAIGRGVKEAVVKDGLLGAFSGGLSATATGITVALVAGLVASVMTTGKPKRM